MVLFKGHNYNKASKKSDKLLNTIFESIHFALSPQLWGYNFSQKAFFSP